jgi:hypothetical protein
MQPAHKEIEQQNPLKKSTALAPIGSTKTINSKSAQKLLKNKDESIAEKNKNDLGFNYNFEGKNVP